MGFPGGSVVKNLPECREHGFDSWSGKIPHTMRQLSPHTTTTEPGLYSLTATATEAHVPRACALQQEKPLEWVAVSRTKEEPLLTATGEGPHVATKTQHSHKINTFKKKLSFKKKKKKTSELESSSMYKITRVGVSQRAVPRPAALASLGNLPRGCQT